MKTFLSQIARSTAACAAVLMTLAIPPARADTTPWASTEGGRMRLVALPADAAGKVRAGLQIEPTPGWKTYWREPGGSGIPPQITVAAGSNVSVESIAFPVPKRLDDGGVRDIGYDAPLTLLLDVAVTDTTKPVVFRSQAFIGLCKNICIPFQADFDLTLAAAAQSLPEETAILDAAAAALPEQPSPGFSVVAFALAEDMKTLHVALTVPEGGPAPEVIVTGPSSYVFTTMENVQRQGREFAVDMPIAKLPKNYAIAGKSWGLLVKAAGGRSMETTLAFD